MFNAKIFRTRRFWIIAAAAALVVLCVAVPVVGAMRAARAVGAQARTAQVTTITALSTVETSGQIAALQSGTLNWGTTGFVAQVNVQVGDPVKAGEVLMELDPTTAPQNVILAQNDLISAQKALEDLLHPGALTLANAQKAAADAQQALETAQRALRNLISPDAANLQDQYQRAQESLTAAQQNAEITNFATSLRAASDALDSAISNLKKYQDLEAQYPGYGQQHGDVLVNARKAYDRAIQDYQTALFNLQQAQARNANAITDAQQALDTAKSNLDSLLSGPDQVKLAQAQAKVAVAQATLAEAQKKLGDLQNGGDPNDVAAARARVQAAQASVNAMKIIAPFDGEVLVINYQPGDPVSAGLAAAVVANRSQLHVEVSVDESDVTAIRPGNPATVTFDSLAGVKLSGQVSRINAVGQTSQGLVRYTLRVDLDNTDPTVLLGMTANVTIVTKVQAGALAVPLEAVQLDQDGEFVYRLGGTGAVTPQSSASPGGAKPTAGVRPGGILRRLFLGAGAQAGTTVPDGFERVPIVSGETQGDLVVVTAVNGDLQPGDVVLIVPPQPTNSGSPFGPG